MHLNNKIIAGIVCLLVSGFFSGCIKKELTANQSSIKEYGFNNAIMTAVYIEQTSANQLLIIGSENTNVYVMKTDLKGNVISHKLILLPDTFNRYNNNTFLEIRSMHNGTYLCDNGPVGKFMLIDSSGKFLWDVHDSISQGSQSNTIYSPSKKEYILGLSDGSATGAYSTSYLDFYNASHHYTGRYTYPDMAYKYGKTLNINPIGTTKSGAFKVFGTKILNFNSNFNAPTRIYVGTTSGQYLKTKIIDSAATGISDIYQDFFINSPDSGIIIYGYRNNENIGVGSILFLRFDANLNFLGESQYNNKNLSTQPLNMCQCRDGGYLICGVYNPGGLANNVSAKSYNQPYVVRIDKNGNKLWDKSFTMPGETDLFSVLELADGSIMLGGSAYGFGKAQTGTNANMLLIKLDANGNLAK